MVFFAAFKVRIIQECDTVHDFLKLDETNYGKDDSEPETHEYNADEELADDVQNGNIIVIISIQKVI